jgi:hypothetical protein
MVRRTRSGRLSKKRQRSKNRNTLGTSSSTSSSNSRSGARANGNVRNVRSRSNLRSRQGQEALASSVSSPTQRRSSDRIRNQQSQGGLASDSQVVTTTTTNPTPSPPVSQSQSPSPSVSTMTTSANDASTISSIMVRPGTGVHQALPETDGGPATPVPVLETVAPSWATELPRLESINPFKGKGKDLSDDKAWETYAGQVYTGGKFLADGFVSAAESTSIKANLCKRIGYCTSMLPSFTETYEKAIVTRERHDSQNQDFDYLRSGGSLECPACRVITSNGLKIPGHTKGIHTFLFDQHSLRQKNVGDGTR